MGAYHFLKNRIQSDDPIYNSPKDKKLSKTEKIIYTILLIAFGWPIFPLSFGIIYLMWIEDEKENN